MQPIEEFMQRYFARRTELFLAWDSNCAPFRAKHFSGDYLAKFRKLWDAEQAHKRENPPVVLHVEICQQSAEVITSEFGQWDTKAIRHRYHLQFTEAGWRIDRKGVECFVCKGTGRKYENSCSYCNETGWRYTGPSGR